MNIIRNERGFTVAELLVSSLITMAVLGGAVSLTSQVQKAYRLQMEDSAAEQEGRYALDWISRLIRGAANDPFGIDTDLLTPGKQTDCPDVGTPFDGVGLDPDIDGENDDIRLQTDANPPDGFLGGVAGTCDQANEDVTVTFDPDTFTITFTDNNIGGGATVRTDAVIDNLTFIFKNSLHEVTVVAANVMYVEIQVRVRTRTIDAATGSPITRTLTQEVRIRGRNF
jgi:hypothetical protein